MDREPLAYLSGYVQPGVVECLSAAKKHGMRLAVLSDYPAEAKLRAMGLLEFFHLTLSAQSPDIGVFKPHPRGLQLAMRLLGVGPDECMYVGDRAEVDGAAAEAAGVAAFILGPGRGFDQLRQLVVGELNLAQPVLDPA
jgi:FMN phosphatase YigB (HAD superfamily)